MTYVIIIKFSHFPFLKLSFGSFILLSIVIFIIIITRLSISICDGT